MVRARQAEFENWRLCYFQKNYIYYWLCCLHIFGHLIRYPVLTLTLTPYSHVLFSSSYFWSRHSVITLHLISFLPLSYTYHDYHPSPLSPHITQHNASQLTHHHINTMTISHSPADDGRKNSSESSCYAYIYCYFYVFTQLYKSLKYIYCAIIYCMLTSFFICL